ncbi:restriction endonuclease subunit S [Thiobacillus sp.]
MNPAQLLAHFDRISEAPGAVARLRSFIFDLAMRGKLVVQDPNDEAAAETLRRAQRKVPAVISDQPIPASWVNVPLETLAANTKYPIGDGDHGQIKPACYQDSGIPYIRVADMGWGTFEPNGLVYIPEDVHEQNLKSELLPGDILVAKTGATIGKCCIVPESIPRANTTSSVGKVTVDEGIVLPKWIIYYFLSDGFKEKMWAVSKKTAQPGFNISNLKQFIVPLPPFAEQHRIVAKADELMALCDQLEAEKNEREARRDRLVSASLHRIGTAPSAADEPATEVQSAIPLRDAARFHLDHLPRLTSRPEHIKQLRQTILNLAVHGRLVPQDPNEEPAAELLKRIEAEKARLVKGGKIRKQQQLPPLDSLELPFEVPGCWEWLRLGNIGFTQTGTTPSSNTPEYFGDYIPFVKPANLTGKNIDYSGEGISEEGIHHSRLIPKNSALMVCIGSTIGKVNVTDRDVCCNQQINTVTPYQEHLTAFTALALKATYFQKLVMANAGMGTLPIISKGKWEVLPIPLPPLAEQYRIVARVDELMALCDQLEAQLTATQTDNRRLLEAVLHEALAPSLEKAA